MQNSGCQGGEAFQPGVGVVLSSEHGWASQGHGFLPSTHPSVSPRAPCVAPPRLAVRWGVKHVGFGVKHIQGWMHTLALASKLFKSRSFNFSSFEKWRYFLVGKVFNTCTYLCTVGFKTHQSSWSSQVHRFSEVIGSCWTVFLSFLFYSSCFWNRLQYVSLPANVPLMSHAALAQCIRVPWGWPGFWSLQAGPETQVWPVDSTSDTLNGLQMDVCFKPESSRFLLGHP